MITISDSDFLRLVDFVRDRFGINLEHKRQLINARMAFDICKRGYTGFEEYVSNVTANPDGDECRHMINRLSTNYTFFFREPEYIEKLRDTVIVDFASRKVNHLRIWCAACSSGEEPYSIAMALETQKSFLAAPFDYEIVGTDINTEMLETAERGKYSIEKLRFIPEKYRRFTSCHTSDSFEIAEKIRKKIKWKYKNLMDKASDFDEYDIIFCRNVMIYFTPSRRREMTAKLYSSLLQGGYLFTGATESIDLDRKYFQYISPTFYRKK